MRFLERAAALPQPDSPGAFPLPDGQHLDPDLAALFQSLRTTVRSTAALLARAPAAADPAACPARIDELIPALIGTDPASRGLILRAWALEKVMHEAAYEINSRPDRLEIPPRAPRTLVPPGPPAAEGGPR